MTSLPQTKQQTTGLPTQNAEFNSAFYVLSGMGADTLSKSDRHQMACRNIFEHDVSLSETVLRAAHPRRNPRVIVALRRIAAVGSSVARLPRFASKTIRSLAHFHDAGDEGNALVMIRRRSRRVNAAAIRGPRRKYFRWGKASDVQ